MHYVRSSPCRALHTIHPFNPFVNPGMVVRSISQMRNPCPREGRSPAPGRAAEVQSWHHTCSPEQQLKRPHLGSRLPGPPARQEFSPSHPPALLCSAPRGPSTSAQHCSQSHTRACSGHVPAQNVRSRSQGPIAHFPSQPSWPPPPIPQCSGESCLASTLSLHQALESGTLVLDIQLSKSLRSSRSPEQQFPAPFLPTFFSPGRPCCPPRGHLPYGARVGEQEAVLRETEEPRGSKRAWPVTPDGC